MDLISSWNYDCVITTLFFGISGQIEYICPVRLPRKSTSNISSAEEAVVLLITPVFCTKDDIGSLLKLMTCSAEPRMSELRGMSKLTR